MNQNPSKEVVAATAHAASNPAKVKKIARVTGAAVFTFAMFGALALPAYAFDNAETPVVEAAASQSIAVTAGPAVTPIDDIPLEVDTTVAEQERRDRELKEAEKKAAERAQAAGTSATAANGSSSVKKSAGSAVDVPAGVGASGIVSAALAQLGQQQDCTALVERSLRAVGYSVGDLGPAQFAQFGPTVGYVHGQTALAPGDILIWGNAHVAIYVGNGGVVHGGWTGGTTALAGLGTYHGLPTTVVRMS